MTPLSPSYVPGPAAAGREGTRGAPARPLFENPFFYFAETSHLGWDISEDHPTPGWGNSVYPPPLYPFREIGASMNSDRDRATTAPDPGGRGPAWGGRTPPE